MIAELKSATLLLLPSSPLSHSKGEYNIHWEKPGLVKNLLLPAPPDEQKIKELNELAAGYPFCITHKAKKHEML
jgi:hypothetical protein